MKKNTVILLLVVLVIIAACVCLVKCRKSKPTLHIYNWGDYLSSDVVADFEEKFDCRVKIDVFDSNEAMYAKLKAGAGGYDILVPSSYMAKLMYEQGMLQDLNPELLPNVRQYFDRTYSSLSLDPELKYSVPYFVSFTGIGYNSEKVKDFTPSWSMFERASLNKRCSLLNDLREVLGAALCTLGYDVNTTSQSEIDEAVALVRDKWKPNIAKFEVDDAKRALAAGEFTLIQTYSGDMLQVMAERPEISFVIPDEGSTVTFDNLTIASNAKNVELAHAFINFIYDPKECAANMDEIMYVTPHTTAVKFVDEELQANPAFNLPPEVRAKCHTTKDLGDYNTMYNRAWEQIRQE